MSATGHHKKSVPQNIKLRKGGEPLVCLTSYTAWMTKIIDPYCDIILVGDSLGMVVYGMESTLSVTLEMMIAHGKAVAQKASHALVVVDLPFGTYQESPQQAFASSARVLAETGADAVKLEGGSEMAPHIGFLTQRGIPVMGHIGLQPQSVKALGGYRVQGKTQEIAEKIERDAQAVAKAGAFAMVLEAVPEVLAEKIATEISLPIVGIGASAKCDGQILVTEDLLGFSPDFTPKFVKKYAHLAEHIQQAVINYQKDVLARRFPNADHCF